MLNGAQPLTSLRQQNFLTHHLTSPLIYSNMAWAFLKTGKTDDIIEIFITERIVKHWNKLPKEEVEASSLEVLKRPIDVLLRDMV